MVRGALLRVDHVTRSTATLCGSSEKLSSVLRDELVSESGTIVTSNRCDIDVNFYVISDSNNFCVKCNPTDIKVRLLKTLFNTFGILYVHIRTRSQTVANHIRFIFNNSFSKFRYFYLCFV